MIQGTLMAVEGEFEIKEFSKQGIRRIKHNGQRYFSVIDIISALVDTKRPGQYWGDLRARLQKEGNTTVLNQIYSLEQKSSIGIPYHTDFIKIEDIFRVMQSIKSDKAEPFKKWLAKVGFERLQEIENPEIALQRAMAIYKAKGYSDERIDARIGGILARKGLTEEWKKKGVEDKAYGMLTNAMHVETFDIAIQEHMKVKGLKSQSLRDNMTPIENTLIKLAEQTTTEILKSKEEDDINTVKAASVAGGKIAGTARKSIEEQTGKKVVSPTNYLTDRQRKNNSKDGIDNIGDTMRLLGNLNNESNEK